MINRWTFIFHLARALGNVVQLLSKVAKRILPEDDQHLTIL
jgi:hypothetical protein